MVRMLSLALLSMFLATTYPKIMRNNALITKMVSQFQGKDNSRTIEPIVENMPPEEVKQEEEGNPTHVLSLMQNILCKNFPTVPCEMITKDSALRTLIEKSIQQLKYKKMTMERMTSSPNYQLTLFPVMNSEDLSNFLQVSNTGSFKPENLRREKDKKRKKNRQEKNHWSHETRNKSRTAVINGRKKIRKFYPHKYKDKGDKKLFQDYSDEKLSMSVETPLEHSANIKRKRFSFRGNPSDPPVWRIDYTKHGEPSLNMFGYDSAGLKGMITKSGSSVVVDNIIEQSARRDVLHPDVYIKNDYSRKSSTDNSDAIE